MDRRILAAGWVLLAALAACENFQKLREEYCATTGATTDACVRDTDPPLPPVLVAPASPANDNNPSVTGTAEAGSTIRLYASADCAGEVSGTGVVTPSGAFAVAVTVGDDTTTSFSATATDAAGNVSGCSASVTYVEDSTPPVVPALAGSVPMPPANDNNPSIFGTAEPGSTIRLYTDCAGAEAVSGSVDPDGSFSIVVSVGDNTTTTFFARAEDAAGNRSECSQGFVYVENSQLPVAPQLTGTSPASPANENNPSVAGTAEAGTTVRLYTTSNCSGAVAGMGNVDGAGAFSISVSVADNSSATFYATATNTLSLTSACSTGLLYVEDSQPPVLTVSGTVPASPANSNNPSVTGMTEGAATVRVFTNNNCGGAAVGVAVAAASGEFFVPVSVGDNSSTSFYGQAEDAAGNRSSCTGPVTYAEDSIPPSATGASVSDGVAPAEIDYQQTVATVDAYWSGFTNGVAAYEYNLSTSTGCAGEAIATMNVGNVIAKSTSGLTLAEVKYFHCVRALDAAGNATSWVASDGVTVDVTAPTVSQTSPASGATNAGRSGAITLTFSEPIVCSPLPSLTMPVPGTASCDAANTTITFQPSKRLVASTPYTASVGGAIDAAGNTGSAYSWSFITGPRQWTTPVNLGPGARAGSVAADENGNAVAVWTATASGTVYANRFSGSAFNWGGAQPIGSGEIMTDSIATGSNGRVVAIWCDGVEVRSGLFDGSGWVQGVASQGTPPPSCRIGFNVDLGAAADRSGRATALWFREDGAQVEVRTNRSPDGTTWPSVSMLALVPLFPPPSCASVAMDGAGNAVAMWCQEAGRIRASFSLPASGWTSPVDIGAGQSASLAAGDTGTAIGTWRNGTTIQARRFDFAARSTAGPFTIGTSSTSAIPSIAMNASGQAVILWSDGNQMLANHYVAGSWGGAQTVNASAGDTTDRSVVLDASGNAVAVWSFTGYVYASQYLAGTGWGSRQTLSTNGTRPTIAIDGTGAAVALWTDGNSMWASWFE